MGILVLYILNFNFKFSVFLTFCAFSSIILLRQSDFKCLVAYSSVLHINFCFIRILGFSFNSNFGAIFMGLAHAFTSPLIFLCVYLSYNFVGSRQILQFCSFNFSKIFQIILVLVYIFNLRFPLLGGFMSEVFIFTFQVLTYTFKFSSFNFNYFDSILVNFYNFRF